MMQALRMHRKRVYTVWRYIVWDMLREPTFLILSAVVPGPLHGYGILRLVENLSGGRVQLRAGTLYSALERMVRDEWLAVDGEEVVDGRLRRYYKITNLGIDVLDRETANLESNAASARRQLALRLKPGLA